MSSVSGEGHGSREEVEDCLSIQYILKYCNFLSNYQIRPCGFSQVDLLLFSVRLRRAQREVCKVFVRRGRTKTLHTSQTQTRLRDASRSLL